MSQIATPPCTPWPDSLLAVLERQQQVVDELAGLASAQAPLIAEGRSDRLLELLSKRQALIDEFTSGQSELGDLTRGLEQRLEGIEASQRERIRSLISQIGARLAQVLQRDEQDQAALRAGQSAIKHELSSLGTARQARTAYLGPAHAGNRFADHRG
jgi:hypothetical protein